MLNDHNDCSIMKQAIVSKLWVVVYLLNSTQYEAYMIMVEIEANIHQTMCLCALKYFVYGSCGILSC